MDEVHKYSTGIPRVINRIYDKSLMYAFQQQKRLVDDHMVQYIAETRCWHSQGASDSLLPGVSLPAAAPSLLRDTIGGR